MPTINQLAGLSQVSGGDLLPIYVPNNGDARKVSVTQLLTYFQTVFAAPTVSTKSFARLASPGQRIVSRRVVRLTRALSMSPCLARSSKSVSKQ